MLTYPAGVQQRGDDPRAPFCTTGADLTAGIDMKMNDADLDEPVLHDAHVHEWKSYRTAQIIAYSWGTDKYDNHPEQRTAENFPAFAEFVQSHRAKTKGKEFFCAPFRANGDGEHHRCKADVLPRRFLSLDFDYIADDDTFTTLLFELNKYRHFSYTTASHKPESPRLRSVIELSRPVDRAEGIRLGKLFQRDLIADAGIDPDAIEFDRSVFRGEQPCYGLTTKSETYPLASYVCSSGAVLDVDKLLASETDAEPEEESTDDRAKKNADADPFVAHLRKHRYMIDMPAPAVGKLPIRCPNAAAHSSETSPTSCVVLLPHFNGVARTTIKCLHASCEKITQAEFRKLTGFVEGVRSISIDDARLPADWVEFDQQPPPFVVERLLPDQEAGSLVGPGGTGKSTVKLVESVQIILGRPLYGRTVHKPGAVLCVSKEDRSELIDYRLKKICRALGLSSIEMRTVHKNFLRYDLRGDEFMLQRNGVDRIPCRSGDVSELLKAFEGAGLASCWFDTASRFGTGENNEEAAVLVDACTVLADQWKCAVEILHHVSQTIARSGTVDMHAGRGGTAFIDNGRFARQMLRHNDNAPVGSILYPRPAGISGDADPESVTRMHVVKLTGARYSMHTPIWLERRGDWEFVWAEGDTGEQATREDRQAEARGEQANADDIVVLAFIKAQLAKKPPACLSQNDMIEARERVEKGISAHRVRSAIHRLKLDGQISERSIKGVARGSRTYLAPTDWVEPF